MIKLYKKYKEIINYLIAGGVTTVVSFVIYKLSNDVLCLHYVFSNILSWVVAVLFAYVVNRKYVFCSHTRKKEKYIECLNFIKYRILSLVIETVLIYILIEFLKLNSDISKIIGQIVTIILNYVFSKLFTFKKK